MLSHNQIYATVDQEIVILYVSNWKFMAAGQGHIVLENIEPKDQLYHKVLRVCKHPIDTLPPQFESTYRAIISKMPNLSTYLHKRHKMTFKEQDQDKFFKMIKDLCDFDLKNFRAYIAQNLTNTPELWDYILQFKPKTPLPDIYSSAFLKNFCEKHAIAYEEVKTALEKSEPQENMRWFKKNALKEGTHNLNALKIFSINTQEAPNYLSLLKPLSENEKSQVLTNEILAKSLNETKVFEEILKLQFIHNHESDFSSVEPFFLWSSQAEREKQIAEAREHIIRDIQNCQNPREVLQDQYKEVKVIKEELESKDSFESILRFLMSWSWRDISVMFRVKLNSQSQQLQKTDMKIIDYELKDATKLTQTIEKDSQFLENYLKFKKLLL